MTETITLSKGVIISGKEIENPFTQGDERYEFFEILKSNPEELRPARWIVNQIEDRGFIYPIPLEIMVASYFKQSCDAGEEIFDRVNINGDGQTFLYRIHRSRWPKKPIKSNPNKLWVWILGVWGSIKSYWEWIVQNILPFIK